MSIPAIGSETTQEILDAVPGEGQLVAILHTNLGDVEVELYEDRAPNTVANFVGLAMGTKTWRDPETGELRRDPYYDGVIFHRIIKNFMIQGGDRTGTGRGGPGYQFADEFHPELRHTGPGILSMANAGPGTNGSQFFICEVATPHLDGRHAVFGKARDEDLVVKIASVPTARGDRPVDPVTINKVTVKREG